jgi:hypothetical protein
MTQACLCAQHPALFFFLHPKRCPGHVKDVTLLKAEGRISRERNSCSLPAALLLLFLVLCTWVFPFQEAGADDKATYNTATSGTSWTVPNWVTSITLQTGNPYGRVFLLLVG